jgi:PPM family protein phosphatase
LGALWIPYCSSLSRGCPGLCPHPINPFEISAVQTTESKTALKAWGDTDPGRRENNEDRILCEPDTGIFVVADGMGGEAAGEVAAQQAIDAIASRLHQETGSVERRIKEAIAGANNDIYRLAERNPSWRGMACVLTAAIIKNGMLHIGHVGDSRLYRIFQGKIRKLTSDHSPVGQREDAGELSEGEAMRHPRRNEVFRDVGSKPQKPDSGDFIQYIQMPFENDAALILCSDGLSDLVPSNEILQTVIANAGRPKDSVLRLIEKANAAGGKDNISAIVVEGENFAASCEMRKGTPERRLSFLRSRWAVLCYGLIAGFLAGSFWMGLRPTREELRSAQPDHAAALLLVEPSSLEYPTIAKAMEAAKPGDRVEIGDGEYQETIRLKEGVDVAARSPGKAVLHLTQIVPGADAAISAEGIKRASVSGLVIMVEPQAELPYGIRISSSNVNFSYMEVSGAGTGVLVEGDSSSTIAGSYFYRNTGPGIIVKGEARPYLIGNVVYANGLKDKTHLAPGLYVKDHSEPEVKRNVFSGNGSESIRVQRQELKDRMKDNLLGSGKRTIVVEPIRGGEPRQ